MLAKLSYSVRKMLFYEALTCSCMLEIIDPICFWKKSICMIFGCGDWPIRFSSLFDKTASKETEDVGPEAAIFERVSFSPN